MNTEDLTEVVYLDCNRQNSIKSDSNTNEWEYKIADEALQLPAGTQVSIQTALINKRGLSGGSIIIDEDITERVLFHYYHSDNEMWSVRGDYPTIPEQTEASSYLYLYRASQDQLNAGSGAFHASDENAQGVPEIYRGHGFLTNYTAVPGGVGAQGDLTNFGGTEAPLMAIEIDSMSAPNFPPPSDPTLVDDIFDNGVISPRVGQVDIHIPKGVYGISELAELITDQMNGKMVNLRNGDFTKDFIQEKIEAGTYNGSMDNGRTYIQVNAIANIDPYRNPFAPMALPMRSTMITYGTTSATRQTIDFYSAFVSPATNRSGDGLAPATAWNNTIPAVGILYIPETQEIIKYSGKQFFTTAGYTGTRVNADGSTTDGIAFGVNNNITQLGKFVGGNPANTFERGYLGSPISAIPERTIVFMYWGSAANKLTQAQPGPAGPFQRPGPRDGIFTSPFEFNRLRTTLLTPPTGTRDIYSDRKDLIYARNTGAFHQNPGPSPHKLTQEPILNAGGGRPSITALNHGRDFKRSARTIPMRCRRDTDQDAVSMNDLDYNPCRDGYYIGTPDFNITYDTDASAYSINNLHQSYRIPQFDNYGNTIESAGEEAVFYKKHAKISEIFQDLEGEPIADTYINPDFRESFKQPVHRYGGIAVFNWGQTTAQKLGDIDTLDPTRFNQDYTGNTAPGTGGDNGFKNLLSFNDYFSSRDKAKRAWDSTLWSRLGFSYEQLCDERFYETNRYYNRPVGDDTRVFGTTTRGDFDVGAAPSISTTYNTTISPIKNNPNLEHIAPRFYDNTGQNQPIRESGTNMTRKNLALTPAKDQPPNYNASTTTNEFSYFSSMWKVCSGAMVLTGGRPIRAIGLPKLAEQGYYLITTNLLDQHEDSAKNAKNMPILGIAPLSGEATNDFLNSSVPLTHILNQDKVVNSIKFKVLYPNLKNPDIDENSSILLKIVRPIATPKSNAQGPVQTPQQQRTKQKA